MKRLLACALILLASSATASATDLGRALQFGVLSAKANIVVGKGAGTDLLTGGNRILMQKNASSLGDLIASPQGIVLQSGASAVTCITAGAKVKLANTASCIADTSGTNPELQTLSGAITDAANYASAGGSKTPTQPLGPIKVANKKKLTISDTALGLNVISTPSITVGKNGSLTFSGLAADTVLVQVSGNMKISPQAGVEPDRTVGALPRDHLLFLVLGKSVSIAPNAGLVGTILAPNATCTVGAGAGVIGAILCGNLIKLGPGAGVIGVPSAVTLLP